MMIVVASRILDDVPAARQRTCSGHGVRRARLGVIPDRGGAIVVAPEDVVMAIAVEIADAADMRAVRYNARIGNPVGAAHLAIVPKRDRAIVVAPKDVVAAIAVEIAGADNVPVRRHAGSNDMRT